MQNLIENAMLEEIQLQCVLSAIQVLFPLSPHKQKNGGLHPKDVCLDPLCFYPDLIARAAGVLKRMSEEHSVLGKLNVIWKTLKSLSLEIKERVMLRRCECVGVV